MLRCYSLQRLCMQLNRLAKLRRLLTVQTAVRLIKTMIILLLDYNDHFYKFATRQDIIKLRRLQNYGDQIGCLCQCELVIKTVDERRDEHLIMLMFGRSTENNYKVIPQKNTRNSLESNLIVPRPRTANLKMCFCLQGCGPSSNPPLPPPPHSHQPFLFSSNTNQFSYHCLWLTIHTTMTFYHLICLFPCPVRFELSPS